MDALSETLFLYLSVLFGPFVQEDAAVVYAASLSATRVGRTSLLFPTIILGLFLSDIWKYWIGWAALRNEKARKFTEKKHVADLKDKVQSNAFVTLVTARFVPLTRVPTYIACGLFSMNYPKYCFYIAVTAFMYVSVVFTIFHVLGEILGERLLWIMPVVGILFLILYIGYSWLKHRRSEHAYAARHLPSPTSSENSDSDT